MPATHRGEQAVDCSRVVAEVKLDTHGGGRAGGVGGWFSLADGGDRHPGRLHNQSCIEWRNQGKLGKTTA